MKNHRLFAALCLMFMGLPALAQDWKPIDPSQLSLKTSLVEKDADAEVLLWEVYVDDSSGENTTFTHFLRIKIFNERGQASQGKIDITYLNSSTKIQDLAGRTIKPDGTIIELKKDAVFDREVIKVGKFSFKAKSFAMPGLEPGAIIEYRYREVSERGANYLKLQFQREIPVQVVRYYLKPYAYPTYMMRALTFHAPTPAFVADGKGYQRVEMVNLPAFHEEPQMLPSDEVRTWMLIYYAPFISLSPASYWKDLAIRMHEAQKDELKVNDEIRRAAAEAIGEARTPEQRLERLFDFCRLRIKNTQDDALGLTADQRKKLKDNKTPSDTLKRGYGTGWEIDCLFAALASAAGFESRFTRVTNRSRKFFDQAFANDYFLDSYNVAVKVGETWRLFDPASAYVPFGMLHWQEEGVQTLIIDPKAPTFILSPISPAERSRKKRTAELRLLEDGTLEGEARIEYTGHFAVEMKEEHDEESPEQREEKLTGVIKKSLSGAQISEIRIESATDPIKPVVHSYKVRVPGYAARTGKRLFLPVAFFQQGAGPLFPSADRQNDVYFHFPWTEEDEVSIKLPEGYGLDNPEAPASIKLGNVGNYDVKLSVTKDGQTLIFTRNFRFTALIFAKASYPNLKRAFDSIHQEDNRTITLKQGAVAAVKQ
ncbi:MAG TPA: DUF3857 domain-containing protein [Blastocatellia bacterium]|nr:DUF3857 domain-containing protein [Blastocatellia bacterium]